jgi:Spy/CpxP family protein refolding chaperone
MKRGFVIACLISLAATAAVFAQGGSTNAPPEGTRPMRPMMGNLLPPRVLEQLALTGDQQSKYDALDTSFKSDVAKLRAPSSASSGSVTNAPPPPSGGRQQMRELRRSYIEKVRAFLTADQNAKLTQAMENMANRRRGGGGPAEGSNSPAQTPPPSSN